MRSGLTLSGPHHFRYIKDGGVGVGFLPQGFPKNFVLKQYIQKLFNAKPKVGESQEVSVVEEV